MKNINELLGTEYPLIQGGMANISDHKFAAAVSNAGGLGLIAASSDNAENVRKEIRVCRELTDRPFGVNIMLMNPHAPEIADMVIEEKISVVTTGAGNPGKYIPGWSAAGIVVIPVVPSCGLALRMERAGADAVIAEGQEAGGHIGELTTMTLIPQVADSVSIPVIAAGGIGDHRSVLAAFALGARGVQVGTILLASEECPVHDNYKKMVLNAKDISTIVTGRQTGAPVRVLKNLMAKRYNAMADQKISLEELEKLTLGSLRRAVIDGDIENGSFMAGQIAGLVNTIRPLREIVESLFLPLGSYRKSLEIL
ncbi:MAG: nitronate monooxygenase [Fidelibacterota bacterium]